MPRWHGVAYREWSSDTFVTAVWPLNLVMGWARWAVGSVRHAVPRERDREFRRAYFAGFHAGAAHRTHADRKAIEAHIDRTMEVWKADRKARLT
mgnify:CR=1 FL=1